MAKSVKALITPEVLKWAREKRVKLSLDYAADRLDVTPDLLAAWEDGTDQPTFAQLKDIAKLYRTHISVFYLPAPPTDFKLLADHRRLPESLISDDEQTYKLNSNVLEAYERREAIIEFYKLLEESPPEVTLALDESYEPQRAAQAVREFLQFNTGLLQKCNDARTAYKLWRRIVEARGILVCQTSVNTHLSIDLKTVRGFCIAEEPLPVIVVNPKDNPYGRIFTIVHELVHLGLGKSAMQNTGFREYPDLNPTEVFCNQVAAEVLVPTHELLERLDRGALEENLLEYVKRLSQYFRVNPEVILRRLLTLGYISRKEYRAYRDNQFEKYKDSSATPGPIPVPYHTRLLNAAGEHFARTAFTAYYEQKITLVDLAASFSKCDPKHIPKLESAIFA